LLFAGAALMGLAVITDLIEYWMVLVAGVVQGVAFGFYGPARVAFAADLVGRDQLGNAITLSLLSMSGTRVFAPSLAGVLAGVAFFGVGGAYLISAGFSLFSLIAIWRLPSIPIVNPSTRRPVEDIKLGVQYVAGKPSLRRLVLASVAVIMFGFNYVAFIPALVKDVFGYADDAGNTWIGVLSMASAIGAVAVSIPLASRADSARAKWLMGLSGFLFGAAVVALAAAPSIVVAFLIIVVIGAATTTYQSLSNTLALQMADDEFQGRVQSIMQLSFAAFGMLALPLGVLAEVITLEWTIVVMGGVAFAASAAYWSLELASGGSDSDPSHRSGPSAGRSSVGESNSAPTPTPVAGS
jgi:predicted MFS family arabinose efflux permease